MSSAKEQRQAEYLRVVSETGSMVQARRKVGVTSKTVANWRLDSDFVAAVEEALEESADKIRQEIRRRAMEGGSDSLLALLAKTVHPELRPAGNQVAVQVNAGSAEARFAKLPDEALMERARAILDDTALRRQAGIDVVDVVQAPEASALPAEAVRGIEPDSAAPAGSGEAEGLSAEDLI